MGLRALPSSTNGYPLILNRRHVQEQFAWRRGPKTRKPAEPFLRTARLKLLADSLGGCSLTRSTNRERKGSETQARSRSPLPIQPVTDRTAHHQLEVAALEPRQLLGEQRDALAPRARHARDVRAPEESCGAERVVKPVQIVVDVQKWVNLPGVARRPRRLHRDVGVSGERDHLREICPQIRLTRGAPRWPTEVIENQPQVRMAPGNLLHLRKEPGRHQRDGQARPLGGRPQPIDGTVRQPRALLWRGKREAQAEHPRALLPRFHESAAFRLVDREVAEDDEPIGMLPRRLDGQLVRIRIPRRVRREYGGIDTGGVHLAERVGLGVRGDLTVPGGRGLASVPEVDLSVDDQHVQLLGTAWSISERRS